MPTSTGKTANITELMSEATTFLLLLTTNNADLVTKLTALLCKRVDM
jgi:hypothetical protein